MVVVVRISRTSASATQPTPAMPQGNQSNTNLNTTISASTGKAVTVRQLAHSRKDATSKSLSICEVNAGEQLPLVKAAEWSKVTACGGEGFIHQSMIRP